MLFSEHADAAIDFSAPDVGAVFSDRMTPAAQPTPIFFSCAVIAWCFCVTPTRGAETVNAAWTRRSAHS